MTDPEAIVAAVVADETLTLLIAGRIHPLVLPPEPSLELPAVTYGLVSQPTIATQEGNQYRSPKWRLKIWSLKYADLVPIAQAIAGIFGDPARTPFPSSRIEYPSSRAEDHEADTNRYWRAIDVVVGLAPAGAVSQ
jgi:hypothetical protein